MKKTRRGNVKVVSPMSDEAAITMLQGMITSITKSLPEEQRERIRQKVRDKQRHNAKQRMMSVGLMLDAVGVMTMDNFDEVINSSQSQIAALEKPVSMDSLNDAQSDLRFVHAVLDTLFSVSGQRMDELNSETVCSLSSEALDKIDRVKKFIDAVPA